MHRTNAPATARLLGAAAVTAILSCGLALHSAWAHDGPDGPEHHSGMSKDELAQQLANPISNIWSIQLQNNMTFLRGDPSHSYRGEFTSNLQPVMPLHLTEDWNLILRPVFNFTSKPTLDSGGDWDRATGIGQTSLITLFSPKKVKGGLLWGAGPTFIFPTTTRDDLSQRKYAIGPAAVFLKMSKKWVYGIFPQYWWSYSGTNKRREVSQANIQYFLWRSLGDGWQIGMSPNISYNRKASGPNAWTVPIGLGVQKVEKFGKLPVKFSLELQAMVIHPDDFGQRWNIRFAITPVIPALIKRDLF
jgi:hypothetical protein